MHSSLWSAGRNTHLKIVAVSLMASIVVVMIGANARHDSGPSQVAVKAGQPAVYTDNAGATIR
jgi:hypothetical protein